MPTLKSILAAEGLVAAGPPGAELVVAHEVANLLMGAVESGDVPDMVPLRVTRVKHDGAKKASFEFDAEVDEEGRTKKVRVTVEEV